MLSTKDIPGGKTSKTISEPGNLAAKLVSLELINADKFPRPGAKTLYLHIETPPLNDFEGFFIDKADESKGRYKGQIARVKANYWPYADSVNKAGKEFKRDAEILRFMINLCIATTGSRAWIDANDGKHADIDSYVKAFVKDALYKDKFINFCLAGKEYKDDKGYTKYDFFLPNYTKTGIPMEAQGANPSKLIEFDPLTHIEKMKESAEVSNFGGTSEEIPAAGNPSDMDFKLE